ncbi:MAG: hypothetical protein P4L71_21085 [Acetobacteraceae bacterium]|nr:hypothetical protein [Acetobacteraceae bacterium]
MRNRSLRLCASAMPVAAFILSGIITTSAAQAHVKWFAPYDVASAPVALRQALNPGFAELAVLAIFLFWGTCRLERTPVGAAMLDSIESIFCSLRVRTEAFIRAGVAAFFVAISATGGIILTPELKTASPLVPVLQGLIAVGLFWRTTLPVSALGMVALFAIGLWNYGLFHMMDYPIFLGTAAYIAMIGFRIDRIGGLRALDIVRWGTAVTLMWASVEKWAYPEWSYPVLRAHAQLTMGLDVHFYMTAAGMVEFALSFGLLWTPLVRRLSAVVLLTMFISAVLEFGKIDAIGHLPIVVLLIAIAADEMPFSRLRPVLAPMWLSVALAATILLYYLGHTALFGTAMI